MFPGPSLPDPLPQTEEQILRSTMAEEEESRQIFADLAEGASREELRTLLELLCAEEEDHVTRLRTLLYGLEADRPVVAKWLRSIRRLVPAAHLH
jgi:rubrerythrin